VWSVLFDGVSKEYRRGARYGSLRSDLVDRVARRRPAASGPRRLALDDVSFSVETGEAVGLIGPNGAGKSTALRLVSRITSPTAGRIQVRGRVGALIEVGSGVHPELTGRENIWLYGSVLGLSRADVRARFDDIVDFSGLGDVLDQQVKRYSTGMQLRLGFSVASFLEPSIFVVDEALSVGDAAFQAQCVERMTRLVRGGTTLLFVSHDLGSIESLCAKAVWLERGKVQSIGPAREVLTGYLASLPTMPTDVQPQATSDGPLTVTSAIVRGLDGEPRTMFEAGEGLILSLDFRSSAPLERPHVVVFITDGRPGVIIECSMLDDGCAPDKVPTHWRCECRIDSLPLRPRPYELWIDVLSANGHGRLIYSMLVARFAVGGNLGSGTRGVSTATFGGAVVVPYSWQISSLPE
jgi:lipopolysaccharide transport system ATP-binding protein